MRIIAGSRRSLPLKTVPGDAARPTTDRIKETLFNILRDEIPGAYFLDLFSGSGQIGLEALSRGARYAVFVESGRKQADVIEENIRFTKFEEESLLLKMDVLAGISRLEGKYTFDLLFLDPPYASGAEKSALTFLSHSSIVKPEALIIVEAARDTDFSYLPELGLSLRREKLYKTNKHVFIEKEGEL